MARERMITRTINVSIVSAICMDITTVETVIRDFELTGETYNNESALKELKKLYETDTFKVVAVQTIETIEKMYGMREIDFLKVAQELDPTTRKMLDTEDDN